ncbi:MAG TPA: hypothetical protein VLI41_00060 [Phenylobacterium sp.]|uniref:hypothetical protein n=1 Tax=Phenylobacterium sp. TaxID=1871053 RepID=UPI002C1B979A|nr:hypothetical protein [Phenylobacterium sp.]HSV01569.1 hypothetical protein [Phenylobacterium sp.]
MHGAAAVLKPFAWLAVIAFALGFFGVLAFDQPSRAAASKVAAEPAVASGPASADWNLPKHI